MKKLILVGIISTSLILSTVMPAFAVEAVDTGKQGEQTKVTEPVKEKVAKEAKVKENMMAVIEKKVMAGYDQAAIDAVKAEGVKNFRRIAFIIELSKASGKSAVEVAKLIKEKEEMEDVAAALGIDMKAVKAAREKVNAAIEAARKAFLEEKKAAEKVKKEKAAKEEKVKEEKAVK